MFNTRKIIAAFAIALMASVGTAVPAAAAEAADVKVTTRMGGWCC